MGDVLEELIVVRFNRVYQRKQAEGKCKAVYLPLINRPMYLTGN